MDDLKKALKKLRFKNGIILTVSTLFSFFVSIGFFFQWSIQKQMEFLSGKSLLLLAFGTFFLLSAVYTLYKSLFFSPYGLILNSPEKIQKTYFQTITQRHTTIYHLMLYDQNGKEYKLHGNPTLLSLVEKELKKQNPALICQ